MHKLSLLLLVLLGIHLHASNMLYIDEYKVGSEIPYSLETLFQDIRNNPAFVADYTQDRILPQLKKPLTSSGEFAYEATVGIEIRQKTPVINTTRIQSDKIVQTDASNQKMVIPLQGQAQFAQMAEMMAWLFKGNLEPLVTNFDVFYDADSGVQQVGLMPKSLLVRQFVQSITLVFKNKNLLRMEIKESEKSSTVWTFTQQRNLRAGQAIAP